MISIMEFDLKDLVTLLALLTFAAVFAGIVGRQYRR
jgi:hypothetical protein